MKNSKAMLAVISAAVVVTVGAIFAYLGSGSGRLPSAISKSAIPAPAAAPSTTSAAVARSGQVNFSTSPYAQFAYLISSSSLSPDAQRALTGYDLVKTRLAGGGAQITLRSTSAPAPDQVYTLTSGESLYFVDYVLGDDAQPRDYSPNDDKTVIVDQNGEIVTP